MQEISLLNYTQSSLPDLGNYFPCALRLKKPQIASDFYFTEVLLHLNDHALRQLLSQAQLELVQDFLHHEKQYSFSFQEDFLSALVFRKKKRFMKTTLAMVFFTPTQTKFMTSRKEAIEYMDGPIKYGMFSLGEIGNHLSIDMQVMEIEGKIKGQENIKQSKSKQEKSPSMLQKIVQSSLIASHQTQVNKLGSQKLDKIHISQSGTANYKISVIPKIAHHLTEALLDYLTTDGDLAKVILWSFRMKKLRHWLSELAGWDRNKIGLGRACLQELFVEYKALYNIKAEMNAEVASRFLVEANDYLDKVIQSGLNQPPKIITRQEIVQSVTSQLRDTRPLEIKQTIAFKQFKANAHQQTSNYGFSISTNVSYQRLFTDLEKLKQRIFKEQHGLQLWLSVVELHFGIIIKNIEDPLFLREIEATQFEGLRYQYSPLLNVVKQYENYMDQDVLAVHLPQQKASHVYLIKMIAAALAFEKYKLQMLGSVYDVSNYRVSLRNLKPLYSQFTSMSSSMRKACHDLMLYYQKNREKAVFFQLGNKKSYQEYMKKYFQANEGCQANLKLMKDQEKRQLERIQKLFCSFEKRHNVALAHYEKSYGQSKKLCKSNCQANNMYGYYWNLCQPCKQLKEAENALNQIKNEQFVTGSVQLPMSQTDQKTMATFQHLMGESLLRSIMKLLFQSQISIKPRQNSSSFQVNNRIADDPTALNYKQSKTKYLKLYEHYTNDPAKYLDYSTNIFLYYQSFASVQLINLKLFEPPRQYTHQNPLAWLFAKPLESDQLREHKIYASFETKRTSKLNEIKQMSRQKYIEFASLKVAPNTQIPLLCQGILDRALNVNTSSPHQMQRYLLLSTAADAKALQNHKDQISPIVSESVKQLLREYGRGWQPSDFFSIQVIGPVMGILAQMINQSVLMVEIAVAVLGEYFKVKEENKHDNTHSTNLRMLRLVRSIMGCFWEDICLYDRRACLVFAKVIVDNRINLRFFNRHTQFAYQDRKIIEIYQDYFARAIHQNITSAVNHFKKNLNHITEVVKFVDSSIDSNTTWQFIDNSSYVFKGKADKEEYQINMFTGLILKNGAESNTLPLRIQSSPTVRAIFAQNTDLEVFRMKNGAYRTRQSFERHFPQESGTEIFFEFYEVGDDGRNILTSENNLRIRLIAKRGTIETSYLYIPSQILRKESIFIPEIYLSNSFAWLEESQNHIIFRKKSLAEMGEVTLVLLAQRNPDTVVPSFAFFEARIITQHFTSKPESFLKDLSFTEHFDRLVILQNQKRINKAIEVLQTIELPQFIIQIYCNGYGESIQFWLLRSKSNVKFIFTQAQGLISVNCEGYRVSQQYSHHPLLPWSQRDEVRCLVLTKMQQGLKSCIHHKNMVLIPEEKVEANGKIILNPHCEIPTNICAYDIHDNFLDIRSKTKLSQLQLVRLVCSFQGQIVSTPLKINSQEYAIALIRSCYGNSSINPQEAQKVQAILDLSVQLNLNLLLLCCQVMIKTSSCTSQMSEELRFILQQKTSLLNACYSIYRQRLQENILSPSCKLSDFELNFLGIDLNVIRLVDKKRGKERWQKQQSCHIVLQQKSKKGIKNIISSYSKAIKDLNHLRNTISTFFTKNQSAKNGLPECLVSLLIDSKDSMASEMLQDLLSSYQAFLRYNKKYEQIELNKKQTIQLLITLFSSPRQKCEKLKGDLGERIDSLLKGYSQHLQFLFRIKSPVTPKDYVQILCDDRKVKLLYPTMSFDDANFLKEAISNWILLTLEVESIARTIQILKDTHVDKTALFRQLQSPREQIVKKPYWICFEAEMKIRIWKSQQQTEEHLRNHGNGSVSQLNMGEGKTQVINPMIVLYNIYDPSSKQQKLLSRINVLSSLFRQAQSNYFRFFSVTGFKIPCFRLHISREMEVTQEAVDKIMQALYLFREKVIILQDRQSCLSMILKEREEYLNENEIVPSLGKTRDQWLFCNFPIFDIFDEVDALMTPKKYFVYSIGSPQPLQGDKIRFEAARVILQILCQELFQELYESGVIIADEPLDRCLSTIKKGSFPSGLRFQLNISRDSRLSIRQNIANILLTHKQHRLSQLDFFLSLQPIEQKQVIRFLVDESYAKIQQFRHKLPEDLSALLCLRGILAFGILEHSLTMRVGVDYGVPGAEHRKRVGVPYEAADVPSKRSEYAHPDLAVLVSYVSYFTRGLNFGQFTQFMEHLLAQPASTQNYYYSLMLETIQQQQSRPFNIVEPRQINLDSLTQMEHLYERFKVCRTTSALWLICCVFPDDLKQYNKSIISSSWDLADVQQSLGYSGTKDSHFLLPLKLKWQPSPNDIIKGTDGKMIHLLSKNTLAIQPIEDGHASLWQRLCTQTLKLVKNGVGCIIDAGAILVGKSIQKEIVPWIGDHPLFEGSSIFKGITFCDETGRWKVYDTVTKSVIERGTGIAEQHTFVIFDEARTRGADISMKESVKAVVTLSPNITKDKLMQAVGRLRKFGRRQQVYILSPCEILKGIKQLEGIQGEDRILGLINWACQNSLQENRKLLLANSKLALTHYNTVITREPQVHHYDSSLFSMYQAPVVEASVYDLFAILIESTRQNIKGHKQVEQLTSKIQRYGEKYYSKGFNLDQACERETQTETQVQNITESENKILEPIPQDDSTMTPYVNPISTLSFEFDPRLIFTKNFYECTRYPHQKHLQAEFNELCKIKYVLLRLNGITVITQLEANRLLGKKTANCGPYSLDAQKLAETTAILCRFSDLKDNQLVKQLNIESPVTNAKFFNGDHQFEERQILCKLLVAHKKRADRQTGRASLGGGKKGEKSLSVFELVCHFLKRRNTVQHKFKNSDLEKIMNAMINLPASTWKQ